MEPMSGENSVPALRWRLVRVSWLDSHGPHGWNLLRQVLEPHSMNVESVGWLVQDDEDRVTLMAHVQAPDDDNPCVDGCLTIPRVAIKAIVTLQEKAIP